MPLTQLILFGLIAHAVVCGVVFVLIKLDVLKVSSQVFPLALLLPFWGLFMLVSAEVVSRRMQNGSKQINIHKFTLEESEYTTKGLVQDAKSDFIIPVEEAILINDHKTRRALMMDVISQDSQGYIALLQKARFNEDIEVAHYASIAVVEIQREYEIRIQKCRELCSKSPRDPYLLGSYLSALKSYIYSGLIEESVLLIQRQRYHKALMLRIQLDDSDPQYYYEAINNQLELGSVSGAEWILEQAVSRWPTMEETWVMRIKMCYFKNDGEELQSIIRQMVHSKLFLSEETRRMVDFWSRAGRCEVS